MKNMDQALLELVTNEKHTLRSVVDALEEKGMTAIEASETLLNALQNKTVEANSDYVLSVKTD